MSPTDAATTDRPRAAELVPFADLVGRQEIAERIGVTVAGIDTWRRRYPTFPEPLLVLSGTPIWRWSTVAAWAHATPRRPGRPRKAPSPAAALILAAAVAGIALGAARSDLDADDSPAFPAIPSLDGST